MCRFGGSGVWAFSGCTGLTGLFVHGLCLWVGYGELSEN